MLMHTSVKPIQTEDEKHLVISRHPAWGRTGLGNERKQAVVLFSWEIQQEAGI